MYEKYAKKALQIIGSATQGEKVTILSICKRLDIAVKWIEGTHLPSGYAVVVEKRAYILLKRGQSAKECSVILAHELAHILLGHVGSWNTVPGRTLSKAEQEKEAKLFAAKILKAGAKNIFY